MNLVKDPALTASRPVAISAARVWFRSVTHALVVGAAVQSWSVATAAADADTWTIAGQQGLVRFVIVPLKQASEEAAYARQITTLCEPERTCFLNFYTNSTGAPVEVPLPDAIANEATATFRRSMKNGVEIFMWSCRLKIPAKECF